MKVVATDNIHAHEALKKWLPSLAPARFLMKRGDILRYFPPPLAPLTVSNLKKVSNLIKRVPRDSSDRCPYRSLNTPSGLAAVSRGRKGDASRSGM
jgi:hypothetical protein